MDFRLHGLQNLLSRSPQVFKTCFKNISGSLGGSHERRLLNDLMTNYQKLERPVVDENQAVTLKFGLTLQQILDVVNIKYTKNIPAILWGS